MRDAIEAAHGSRGSALNVSKSTTMNMTFQNDIKALYFTLVNA